MSHVLYKVFGYRHINLYLSYFVPQGDLCILYSAHGIQFIITRISFHQIVICLNMPKKKSLGVRLSKFEIALVTYSPWKQLPSYPPWIVTLLIQAGTETPEEISYIFFFFLHQVQFVLRLEPALGWGISGDVSLKQYLQFPSQQLSNAMCRQQRMLVYWALNHWQCTGIFFFFGRRMERL